jgi:hypothetical protein
MTPRANTTTITPTDSQTTALTQPHIFPRIRAPSTLRNQLKIFGVGAMKFLSATNPSRSRRQADVKKYWCDREAVRVGARSVDVTRYPRGAGLPFSQHRADHHLSRNHPYRNAAQTIILPGINRTIYRRNPRNNRGEYHRANTATYLSVDSCAGRANTATYLSVDSCIVQPSQATQNLRGRGAMKFLSATNPSRSRWQADVKIFARPQSRASWRGCQVLPARRRITLLATPYRPSSLQELPLLSFSQYRSNNVYCSRPPRRVWILAPTPTSYYPSLPRIHAQTPTPPTSKKSMDSRGLPQLTTLCSRAVTLISIITADSRADFHTSDLQKEYGFAR